MSRIREIALQALVFCLVCLVAAGVGAEGVSRLLRADPAPEARRSIHTLARLEEATARFHGSLSEGARLLLTPDLADTSVVVVVAGRDLVGCEDLGRQMRRLRRAMGSGRPLLVWTELGSAGKVERFFRRERVPHVVVRETDIRRVLHAVPVVTPAALLVRADGEVIQGISHPKRFPNMRLRSFAEELTLLTSSSRSSRHLPPGRDGSRPAAWEFQDGR
jgi:hypothetical protein